jgi:SAM-dependent methyltransferase
VSWVVEAFGSWYSTVYPHRDEAEAARLVASLGRWAPLAGARLLDVGCGAGRHLGRFREAGARPVGVDLSPQLLAEAARFRRESGGGWSLVRGDMRSLPVADATFDLVTSLFTSFGYFSPDEDASALREQARALVPGGRHVLDFLNRDLVRAHPNPDTERTSGDWRIVENRRIETAGGRPRVVKRVRVMPAGGGDPVADYEERVTLYDVDDLRALLRASGLTPRETWGDYDGSAWNPAASPRLVVLSERRSG